MPDKVRSKLGFNTAVLQAENGRILAPSSYFDNALWGHRLKETYPRSPKGSCSRAWNWTQISQLQIQFPNYKSPRNTCMPKGQSPEFPHGLSRCALSQSALFSLQKGSFLCAWWPAEALLMKIKDGLPKYYSTTQISITCTVLVWDSVLLKRCTFSC